MHFSPALTIRDLGRPGHQQFFEGTHNDPAAWRHECMVRIFSRSATFLVHSNKIDRGSKGTITPKRLFHCRNWRFYQFTTLQSPSIANRGRRNYFLSAAMPTNRGVPVDRSQPPPWGRSVFVQSPPNWIWAKIASRADLVPQRGAAAQLADDHNPSRSNRCLKVSCANLEAVDIG
jgi:hypothetical protein